MTNIYFAGGGFYTIPYHIGAIKAIQNMGLRNITYYGNSAGSGCAILCYCVMNGLMTIEDCNAILFDICTTKWATTETLIEMIDAISRYWPKDMATRVSGILNIGVSTINGHKFINKFDTNYDLYNALMCGGTLAGFSDYNGLYDGDICIDGLYTFRHVTLPTDIIYIANFIYAPLSLTNPPKIIYDIEKAIGYANTIFGKTNLYNDIVLPDAILRALFTIHALSHKNMDYAKHIFTHLN